MATTTTSDFFGVNSVNYTPDQIVQLQDSKTNDVFSFEKVTTWLDGSTNFIIDDAIYFKKNNADSTFSYYKRVFYTPINVKWFGALGNGTTDDTIAIRAAFDFLFDARDYDISSIIFPAGTYVVTELIGFPSRCELSGIDKNCSKIVTNRNDHDLLYIFENKNFNPPNTVSDGQNQLPWTTIKNITIAGMNRNANPFGWYHENVTTNNLNSGIVINEVLKTSLENVRVIGFETAGIHYNKTYYQRFNHIHVRKNKIGMLVTNTCTSIHGINSEFQLNSLAHSIQDSFSCSFVNCLIESNFAQYMINRIDINDSPFSHNGVAVFLNNSFMNIYSNCYFEAHVCTFYYLNSYENIVNNCYIVPGTTHNFTSLDGYCGLYNNSTKNTFDKNFHTSVPGSNISVAKFYFTTNSISNFFEFNTEDSFNAFISTSATLTNFSDRTTAPTAICPTANKSFYNLSVSKLYSLGSFSGTSLQRPPTLNTNIGFEFFDITLNKPIWNDGTNWRDANGNIV